MKITGIRITNFIGIRNVERGFAHPVVLFAGRNGAGKSSLQEAIRMALGEDSERVLLKKDYPLLVADGAKSGEVVVNVDLGTSKEDPTGQRAKTAIHLPLPEGKPTPFTARPRFLDFCLEPERFASLSLDERRTFLFELEGLKADGQQVMKRLLDKGCEAKYVEAIGEALKRGFVAAHTEAAERARDAKSAWRGVTGETWGKDKAGAWQPKAATFGEAEALILSKVERDLAASIEAEREAGNRLAALTARAEALPLDADPKKAAKVASLTEDLADATRQRDELDKTVAALQAEIESPTPLACPHCGGLVVQEGFQLKPYAGDAEARREARTKLPQAQESLRMLRVRCQSLTRDLDDARTHAAKLEAAKAVKEKGPSPHEITKATEEYQLAKDATRTLREEEKRLSEVQHDAGRAVQKKADAENHHAQVLAWLAVADAVAPSGIPSEILSTALKPFNEKLREAAVMTGWRQLLIDSDMGITAEGRPYALLSESEHWRSDAMLAYAIASRGPRFLLLDRLDVLDINARGEALAWVAALADQRRIDGAVLCATLKTLPTDPKALPANVEAFWLEGGTILDLKAAA